VDLYIHSHIHLHGVVLNYLSTGTVLPYFFYFCRVDAGNNFASNYMKVKQHWLRSVAVLVTVYLF
jgi:hypothetical protein